MPHWLTKLCLAMLILGTGGLAVFWVIDLFVARAAGVPGIRLLDLAFGTLLICVLWPFYRRGEEELKRV